VADAADDAGRPARAPIGVDRDRKALDAQLLKCEPRAEPPGAEIGDAPLGKSGTERGFSRLEELGVRLAAQFGGCNARTEQPR
jgi:hypothetical protein